MYSVNTGLLVQIDEVDTQVSIDNGLLKYSPSQQYLIRSKSRSGQSQGQCQYQGQYQGQVVLISVCLDV